MSWIDVPSFLKANADFEEIDGGERVSIHTYYTLLSY